MWHNLSIKQISEELGVDVDSGLKESEIGQRKLKYGENKLAEEKKLTNLRIFLNQLKSPLVYILIIAFFVTFFLKDYIDTLVIFFAVVLNAMLGFFQERKASNVLELLRQAANPIATVFRDGAPKEIKADDLAVGDIVFLREGDRVPADLRLIESANLKINEASLTGESWPVEKSTGILKEDTPIFERKNMAFQGTAVVEGKARAMAVSVGARTEFGKISGQLAVIEEEETPLQKKIRRFSYFLAIFIGFVAAFIFFAGLLAGEEFINIFLTSVAVAVAAIPEGLPAGVSVALAVGMQRILKKNGLVRRLNSVETLGEATIICMDKTGTLTEGQMQVVKVLTGTTELLRESEEFKKIKKESAASHILALKIGSLVSDVLMEKPKMEAEKRILHGDPLEQAIVLAALHAGLDKIDLEKDQSRLDFLPFSAGRKYGASLNEFTKEKNIIYFMGAPESILEMSDKIEVDGKQESLGKEWKNIIENKLENLTKSGLRVVAVGYKAAPRAVIPAQAGIQTRDKKEKFDFSGYAAKITFVGFIALADPLRGDVRESLEVAKRAGIRPIIITGDHKNTAMAIAREAGFVFDESNIIEGKDLDGMSDAQLEEKAGKIIIYARAVPQHKLRIIKAWQSKGEVVAMTGDGVNDAPALKKADIGIALGSGTEVAKQSADLILLDDNFNVIVSAIRRGRIIFDNIKKVMVFILKDSFSEVILIILSLIFKLPLPILPAQILWINLFQDSLPAFAFALEPGEEETMNEKPQKRKHAPFFDKEMKTLIFIYGFSVNLILFTLFVWLNSINSDITYTRTMIFVLLALGSLAGMFSLKSLRKSISKINIFSNPYLVLAFISGVLLMIAAVYLEPLQDILRTVPLDFNDWLIVVIFAMFNVAFIEVIKLFFRNGRK